MSYSILTAISPEYADTMRIFMPTWIRNSGAARIGVRLLSGDSWSANIIQRIECIRQEVWQAAMSRRQLVWLDADVYVVRSLAEGFSESHPISIARWPNVNAGVIFFNTRVPFDWLGFLDPLLAEIRSRCKMTGGKRGYSDQRIWHAHLDRVETHVSKLESDVWNYTGLWEDWPAFFEEHSASVRALHTRGNGAWPVEIHGLMERTFPREMGVTPDGEAAG